MFSLKFIVFSLKFIMFSLKFIVFWNSEHKQIFLKSAYFDLDLRRGRLGLGRPDGRLLRAAAGFEQRILGIFVAKGAKEWIWNI